MPGYQTKSTTRKTDWTNSRTLVGIYAFSKLVGRYWGELTFTGAIFVSGIYVGTLMGQGV